jgi:hypothetical protein
MSILDSLVLTIVMFSTVLNLFVWYRTRELYRNILVLRRTIDQSVNVFGKMKRQRNAG